MQILKYLQSWEVLAVVAGLLVVWYAITRTRETFVPEFLDQGNVKQTAKTGTSSYAQETNHFQMTHPPLEPIAGSQTPFRVNMFNSYVE